jgi:LysM repeat protein
MKTIQKAIVLVALAIVLALSLSACRLPASTPPEATPTTAGEVPFPVDTQDPVSAFATQTAIASTPLPVLPTDTPQVIVATNTPDAADQGEQPAATEDANEGGGVVQPSGPTPVVERPATYTLNKGEWPICIARRFDLDIDTLFSSNGMNMNSKPATGVTLTIPASGNWDSKFGSRSLKAHPVDYTVVAGDSVYSIACAYGDVTPEAILAVNGLSSAADIQPGMRIRIP